MSTVDNSAFPSAAAELPGPGLHKVAVVVIVLACLIVLLVGGSLWRLRSDTLDSESRTLSTLTTALADQLERGLQGVQVALQATRDDVREGRLVPGTPEASMVLHSRVATLPLARRLWVLNHEGRAVAASGFALPPALRSFLPGLGQLPEDGVALSAPYVDPGSRRVALAMAMPVLDREGTAAGWVVAEVPADALRGAFTKASPAPDARMLIVRADNVRITGFLGDSRELPDPALLIGSDAELGEGRFRFDDGSERLVQLRSLERYPVAVLITRDARIVLQRWGVLARGSIAGTAVVLFVLLALLARMLRAERLRRQSQRALQAEQSRAALAFAAAQEGNWDWDPETGQVYLSPRMNELMGLPREGGGHAPLTALAEGVHAADLPVFEAALQGQLQDADAARIDLSLRVRQADGEWHWIRLRGNAARDVQGRIERVAGVAFDTTDERDSAARTQRLEAQLTRARKLEALGTLAGGVAHDFNNLLAAVVGYGEMARDAAAPGSAQARHLDQVLQAASRGQAVVERILAFSRASVRPRQVLDVQPVVGQVLDLLGATLPAGIVVERHFEAEPMCVQGDATQLFEAVMNLCSNAMHAMHGEGRLDVGVAPHRAEAGQWLSHGELPAGEYVRVCVEDNGVGIAPELMERLFEPFFSTRQGGTGTGLGLAVVQGVIEEWGGAIDVQSTPGQGSRFCLYLPRTHELPAAAPAEAGEVPAGQGQRVMLVDDEQALVELNEEQLAQLGYEPVGFTDPHAAWAALQADPQAFDLVVSDEIMPGLNGTELAERVHRLRPDLPVLLLSGYGGPQLEARAREAGVREVLAKPLQGAALARALAAALGPTLSA
jgi:signal transduction histidine kinase/CheY-like chemotaxis protein